MVEVMVSKALRSLSGQETDAAAWDAIFRYFNQTHGQGERGYEEGEKIAIKINLTTCNARSGSSTVDPATYQKRTSIMNTIDNPPQMILTLLRQLVYEAGVAPADIATRTQFSAKRFDWSTPNAAGKRQDYVPEPFAAAAYIINFPELKGHSCGVTVCAKNHYGSLLRCPDGYLRDAGNQDYYSLHDTLADMGNLPTLGHYRALVDLMGHPELGGKTLLYLVDALYCGYYWDSRPYKWKMAPFGDGAGDFEDAIDRRRGF